MGGTLTVDDRGRVELDLRNLPISEISVLKGMPLSALYLDQTKVTASANEPLNSVYVGAIPARAQARSRLRPSRILFS